MVFYFITSPPQSISSVMLYFINKKNYSKMYLDKRKKKKLTKVFENYRKHYNSMIVTCNILCVAVNPSVTDIII